MAKVVVFPGSFDPLTRGHQAIVESALLLFDKVVIAIGENINKNSLLSIDQRVKLIEETFANEERVECVTYSNLTIDLARSLNAKAIIRGVRNTIDFEYERNMAQTNKRLAADIPTLLLLTPPEYADISSSTVRELLKFGCDTAQMMPEGIDIKKYIQQK